MKQKLLRVRTGVGTGVIGSILLAAAVKAETISSIRINATNRLIPLVKLTVGPYDQYDSAVDPEGRVLIFTHKADLIARLQAQNLANGEVVDLLPLNADSQTPSLSANGLLAFTYFKSNARGDICWAKLSTASPAPIADDGIRCLQRSARAAGVQRSNPFWKSANEIGFLESEITKQSSRVVIQNIETGSQRVLAEGRIWSPSMRFNGKYLAYNELIERSNAPTATRRLMIIDTESGHKRAVHFDLPGISGFPSLSEDDTYLYFSHYLNDTNNDRTIDGGDNAVVFRVPVSRIFATTGNEEILPEQLTSAETSCSFPRPSRASVFVTCAFEGSLDVYRLPDSGVVPSAWDEKRLLNALQTSRSYQDRILLLNALKYRTKTGTRSLDDRLLSNHVLSDDTVAARYYLNRVADAAKPSERSFFELVGLYLAARDLKKSHASEAITREYKRQLLEIDKKARRIAAEPAFRSTVRGLIRALMNDLRAAEAFLRQVRLTAKTRPLEHYFYFELANLVYTPGLPKSLPQLVDAYRGMISAPRLSAESHVYYTFSLLQRLEATEPSRAKRIERIERIGRELPEAVAPLVRAEVATLRLINAADDKSKTSAYKELDVLMNKTRNDYFVRKALYVRAILNLAEAAEFKYLTYIAGNWLRFTAADDTEFIHAREVFSSATLTQAYANLAKGNANFAGNFFYQSLSLTDDLESHAGYVHTMLLKGQKSVLNERYENLRKRRFVDDNMKFVEALLDVIDDGDAHHFDAAIEKLEAMTQDHGSPTRYLLLGYCYMEKLLRLASGPDFDADLFRKSHRSLMLAYDLGRDNARIKASALMNLGILHQRAQNYGLSSRFFQLRKNLGFVSEDERARFEWLYAKTLGRNLQPEQAARELAGLPQPSQSAPIHERQAFYLMSSGRYKNAAELYASLLQGKRIVADESIAKVQLSLGFSLFMLKRTQEAQVALEQAVAIADRLRARKRDKTESTDFEPDRLKIIAYGLLSQIGSTQNRAQALEKRIEILGRNQKLVDEWYPAIIRSRVRLAELLSPSDLPRAIEQMNIALKQTEEYGDSNQFVSATVFRSLTNYLAHGLLHREAYVTKVPDRMRKIMEKCLTAYDSQKIDQPMLDFQKFKLLVLWTMFSTRILGEAEMEPRGLDSLMASGLYQRLKESLPEQAREIQKLADLAKSK